MDWKNLYTYWFGNYKSHPTYFKERVQIWFGKDTATDIYIRKEFSPLLLDFESNKLTHWKLTPQGYLTLIILLDQVPRNSFRNQKESFKYDPAALRLALEGLGTLDQQLNPVEKLFFYLPFEHSEDLAMQKISLKMFQTMADQNSDPLLQEMISENLEYARRHFEMIERFGRFPHRNRILGRQSTKEEIEFLKQPNSSF